MKKIITLIVAVVFFIGMVNAQVADPCNMNANNESEFYTDTAPLDEVEIFPTGVENGDDTQNLQTAINSYANTKKILLKPQGGNNIFYLEGVNIISGTHIRVHKDVILRTNRQGKATKNNASIFNVGKTGTRVSGFSITSIGDEDDIAERFSVDMRQLTPRVLTGASQTEPADLSGESLIKVANAENFKIANFNITDDFSRISTLTFSLNDAGEKNHFKSVLSTSVYPEQDRTPEKGLIKNITAVNGHAGYGLVQIQAAVGLLFKNLEGTGGVPLRVETGLGKVIITKDRTVEGVYGRNIVSNNGLSAVDIAPHNVDQGCVDMEDVSAISCSFTVRIDEGFEDDKEEKVSLINADLMADPTFLALVNSVKTTRTNTNGGTTEIVGTADLNKFFGTFESVKLQKIKGKGGSNAQLKTKFFRFYDRDTRDVYDDNYDNGSINLDMETVPSKSLSVVKYSADPSLDNCNCNGFAPSENGCFQVQIAKTNNVFVDLNRGGNGISTSGIAKIIVDANESTDKLYYRLEDHTASASAGWTDDERPALISNKEVDELFGNPTVPCKNKTLSNDNIVVDKKLVSVNPNPTSGVVNVFSKKSGIIEVYDGFGKLIKRCKKDQETKTINISNESSGVYFLKFYDSEKVSVQKIILE